MSNSQYNEKNEQDELQKYLEEKARQEQEQEIKKGWCSKKYAGDRSQ